MDKILHQERINGNQKVTWKASLSDLPHGTMFLVGEAPHAICDHRVLAWNFSGYREAGRENLPEMVDVLTPGSVVNAFSSGFRPEFHQHKAG